VQVRQDGRLSERNFLRLMSDVLHRLSLVLRTRTRTDPADQQPDNPNRLSSAELATVEYAMTPVRGSALVLC
jgi:hypothetical protein